MCAQLHFNICKETGEKLDAGMTMYQNQECKATIFWNRQVRTGRTIPNNKPEIIICVNKRGICMLIDDVIPGDRSVIQKEA